MSLNGKIEDFGLPDIVQLICAHNKTGILTVTRGTSTKQIHIHNGNITFASNSMNSVENQLKKIVLKSRFASEQSLKEIDSLREESDESFLNLLIKHKNIKHDDLKKIIKDSMDKTIHEAFKITKGTFAFDTDSPIITEEESLVSIMSDNLLLDSMRIMDEWPIITEKIHSYNMVFKIAKRLSSDELEKLPFEDGDIYRNINDRNSIRDIIFTTRMSEFDVFKTMFTFLQQGVIEENTKKSRKTRFNVDFVNPFLEAAVETIEMMSGIFATAGKPYIKRPMELARGEVSGIIGLMGEKKGNMAISFSKRCILKIVSNMLGTNHNYINIEVRDAVGEITNVIAGTGRYKLSKRGFDIHASVPTTIVGEKHFIDHNTDAPCVVIPFNTKYGPLSMEITLQM